MMTLEEVIRTYIRYDGSRQGLYMDYANVFNEYLNYYSRQLSRCNMFNPFGEKADALTITYKYIRPIGKSEYTIYHTDDKARPTGTTYRFDNHEAAADKFLQLYYEDNPTYRVTYNKDAGGLKTTRL